MKISTGEKTLVRENKDRIVGWTFDLKDQLRLATRVADNGDTEVLRLDEKGFTKVYSCNVFESCGPVRFHKDGKRVYFITNKGADIDLTQTELCSIRPPAKKNSLNRIHLSAWISATHGFSEVTDELILTSYEDERERFYWKDKAFEADYKLVQKQSARQRNRSRLFNQRRTSFADHRVQRHRTRRALPVRPAARKN